MSEEKKAYRVVEPGDVAVGDALVMELFEVRAVGVDKGEDITRLELDEYGSWIVDGTETVLRPAEVDRAEATIAYMSAWIRHIVCMAQFPDWVDPNDECEPIREELDHLYRAIGSELADKVHSAAAPLADRLKTQYLALQTSAELPLELQLPVARLALHTAVNTLFDKSIHVPMAGFVRTYIEQAQRELEGARSGELRDRGPAPGA